MTEKQIVTLLAVGTSAVPPLEQIVAMGASKLVNLRVLSKVIQSLETTRAIITALMQNGHAMAMDIRKEAKEKLGIMRAMPQELVSPTTVLLLMVAATIRMHVSITKVKSN